MVPKAAASEAAADDAGAPAAEGADEEKPALYWTIKTRRADKWKERREKRRDKAEAEGTSLRRKKKKKPRPEDKEEESGSDSEKEEVPAGSGEADAEPAEATVKNGKKRKKGEGDATGAQAEAPTGANKRERRKKRRLEAAAAKAATGGESEAAATADAPPAGEDKEDDECEEGAGAEGGPAASEVQRAIHPSGFFSQQRFEDLAVCEPLKKALKENKFETLTEIQSKAIPHLLNGKDVLAAAKTGSGKTLAFLVPSTDLLYNVKFLPRNGVGTLVISPTRELAMQIYDVLRHISAYMSQTYSVVVGGMNRRAEADKLAKGVNTLVATPGRLVDHMQNTKGFVFHNLVNLTIDEADRILDIGFEEEINLIVKMIPKKRQTALFSATQTRKVADLARLSLTKPVFVECKTQDNISTVAGLTQGYVVCPAQSRFLLLFTFLKRNRDKKVMVFLSACNSVKFHDELLNYIDVPVSCIHGHKKQAARSSTYYSFCSADKGILICTDVAARGLDIPKVDWIVQYDPPDEPKEYIHRVGRTARGSGGKGKALLFLMPEELGFLQYLRRAGVPVSEYSFPPSKICNIQSQMERVIEKNYHLHRSSRDAYRSYMHAYAAHSHKDCFDVHKLDLCQVAKAFGFSAPPKVDLNLKHTGRKSKAGSANSLKGKLDAAATGHGFSADNPYGKREAGDRRQFMR